MANQGYVLPASILVANASYTYSSSTGVVSLSNPTGNVTITAVCTLPQLDTPTALLNEDTVVIENVEHATSYDIYDGDTLIANIPVGGVPSGYDVTIAYYDILYTDDLFVKVNNDTTWYAVSNVPNITWESAGESMIFTLQNINKIQFGTAENPATIEGPQYAGGTGDFTSLIFSSTGSSNPAYATGEITMAQNSEIRFYGDL